MKTGIIIPCYNEANRLQVSIYVKFIQSHNEYHLCFVNDGSSDNTLQVLESIKEQAESQVSIIDIKKNAGKAAAVRAGARYLYHRKDIDYIGFIDADLSTDFNDFKKLVETLHNDGKLSFVYGSRGKDIGQIKRTILRSFFSKIIKTIVFLILGLPIADTQCGAKVFKRHIVPVAYNNSFLTRWLFDVEIFIRLKKHFGTNLIMTKICEQSLERWVHVEDSKLGIKDAIKIPFMLLNIWFTYRIIQSLTNTSSTSKVLAFENDNLRTSSTNLNREIAA